MQEVDQRNSTLRRSRARAQAIGKADSILVACFCHRPGNLIGERVQMLRQPVVQLPLSLIRCAIPDHGAIGCVFAERLQTGSIIFHVAKAVACEKSNLSPFVPVRNSA